MPTFPELKFLVPPRDCFKSGIITFPSVSIFISAFDLSKVIPLNSTTAFPEPPFNVLYKPGYPIVIILYPFLFKTFQNLPIKVCSTIVCEFFFLVLALSQV